MGITISRPTVYEEPHMTKYRAYGKAAILLDIFCMLCVLVLPFIFGVLMDNFWMRSREFLEMPHVSFAQKCLLKVTTHEGDTFLWANSDGLQALLDGDPRQISPYFSVLQDDKDGDERHDVITFQFQIPLSKSSDSVKSFEFLPALHYYFDEQRIKVSMETAPFIQVLDAPNSNSNNLLMEGWLKWHQRATLWVRDNVRYDRIYNKSFFEKVSDVYDMSNLATLATRYAKRNESAQFHPQVVSFLSGGEHSMLSVKIVLHVAEASVRVVPSTAEMVKFGWVQYFCIGYVVYWFFWHIRRLLVKNGVVNAVVFFEGRPRGTY